MRETGSTKGVPAAIARDGWWLDPAAQMDAGEDEVRRQATICLRQRLPGLMALVILADVLFWRQLPGLSVALFAAALLAVAAIGQSRRALVWPALLLALGVLPVIEHVQPLSMAILAAALIFALMALRGPARASDIVAVAFGFVASLPRRWIAPFNLRRSGQVIAGLRPVNGLRDWAFPVGGSLVILALLIDANPMLLRLVSIDLDLWAALEPVIFWAGTAILIAPFVARELPTPFPHRMPQFPGLGLNPRSVLRALVLFNGLVAVQMVSDVAILIGGAALPVAMSYAEYAHRGAYPLLATAMLAGSFAMAARPFWAERRLIRPLLMFWLAQNLALCGAAALRLDLYIGAYGLTYLRLYALIWMALVGAGLALLAWQMLRAHGNGWLALRAGGLGIAAPYLCSFVNFADVVAAQNLGRTDPDDHYICNLGPLAAGAVAGAQVTRPVATALPGYACAALRPPRIDGWRDWGFRSWRVIRKVGAVTMAEPM